MWYAGFSLISALVLPLPLLLPPYPPPHTHTHTHTHTFSNILTSEWKALQTELWWIFAFLTAKDDLPLVGSLILQTNLIQVLIETLENIVLEINTCSAFKGAGVLPAIRVLGNLTRYVYVCMWYVNEHSFV